MKIIRSIFLLVLSLIMTGCGRIEVGIVTTPTPGIFATVPGPAQTAKTATPPVSPPAILPQEITATPSLTQISPSSPVAGLVYRDGDRLYRIGLDGQPQPLAPGLDPQILPGQFTPRAVISPDGTQMVSWWDFSDLWLVDLRTGKVHNLTSTSDRLECCAQFWPAQPDRIVFMSQPLDKQGQSISYPTIMNLDGSGYKVVDESSPSLGLPAPSPDGETIAFDRAGEAWFYHMDRGLEPLDPAAYGLQSPSGNLKLASPAWSPDGKLLAWIASGDIGPKGSSVFTPAIFNSDLKTYLLLGSFHLAGGEGWPAAPVWSNDGTWLAFMDYSSAQFGTWIAQPDGKNEKRVYQPGTVRGTTGLQTLWNPLGAQLMVFDPNASAGTLATIFDAANGQSEPVQLPSGAFPVGWPRP